MSVGVAVVTLLALGTMLASAYDEVEVANPGTISGAVTFEGTPSQPSLAVGKDQSTCGDSKKSPRLIVASGGGVANAVVYLKDISSGMAFGEVTPRIDQDECEYVPHVQVAPKNSKLQIINSDDVLHNVHGYVNRRTVFNLAMPIQGQRNRKKLKRAGIVEIACDAGHTWMSAYVYVSEHPYAVATDAEGRFSLDGVPPGEYQIEMWHEGWQITNAASATQGPTYSDPIVVTKTVTVSAGQSTSVDFVLKD
jgi:hypothetical protein